MRVDCVWRGDARTATRCSGRPRAWPTGAVRARVRGWWPRVSTARGLQRGQQRGRGVPGGSLFRRCACDAPLHDRAGGGPAAHPAQGGGLGDVDAQQAAAVIRVPAGQQPIPSPASRHWRPAARRGAGGPTAPPAAPATRRRRQRPHRRVGGQRLGRRPFDHRDPRTPKASILARMGAMRSARGSTVTARPPASVHSTATEPEPPPISHSTSPARGPGPPASARGWAIW